MKNHEAITSLVYESRRHSRFIEQKINNGTDKDKKWNEVKDYIGLNPEEFLFQGILWLRDDVGMEQQRNCILTMTMFINTEFSYNLPSNQNGLLGKNSKTYWLDLSHIHVRKLMCRNGFGFALISGEFKQKFICKSEDDLTNWYRYLKEVAIIDDEMTDYIIFETVGTGGSACVNHAKEIYEGKDFAIKSILKLRMTKKAITNVR